MRIADSSPRIANVSVHRASSQCGIGSHPAAEHRAEWKDELTEGKSRQGELPTMLRPRQIPSDFLGNVTRPDDDVLHGMEVAPQQQHREQQATIAAARPDGTRRQQAGRQDESCSVH